jgi:hypothetical protein
MIMSKFNEVLTEVKNESPDNTKVDTKVDTDTTKVEDTKVDTDTTKVDTDTTKVEDTKVEDKVDKEKNIDKSIDKSKNVIPKDHAKQEKYAWTKINDKVKSLRSRLLELEEENKKLKESTGKKIDKSNFKSEDEYEDARINAKIDERILNRNEDEKSKLADELSKAEYEHDVARAKDLIDKTYPNQEDKDKYFTAIKAAKEAGLEKLLSDTDGGKDIINFCSTSDMAPRIYYHLAMSPKDLVQIVKDNDHASRMSKLNFLESKLDSAFNANKPAVEKKVADTVPASEQVPVIGEIGAGGRSLDGKSDEDLKKMLRKLH